MTVAEARGATVPGTVTLAAEIGRSISGAASDPVAAVIAATGAARLLDGKVVDVERRFEGGFIRGTATIEGMRGDAGKTMEHRDPERVPGGACRWCSCVPTAPDIISLLDEQTGEAIHTERLKYGQRLVAMAMPLPAGLAHADRPADGRPESASASTCRTCRSRSSIRAPDRGRARTRARG